MVLTLRSFLLFLRNLVTFIHKRWDQSTRRLWYIFALLRSSISSGHPKKRSETRRTIEPRPVKPSPTSTTVICASRLPRPQLTPIISGDTPDIASPTFIPIEVRQPTILEDTDEYHENSSRYLNADGSFLEDTRPLSRSPGFSGYHDEPQPIYVSPPPNREELASDSPVTPSRPISRSSSLYDYHPSSQYPEYRPGDRPLSRRQPSEYSHYSRSILDGSEAAARGFAPRAVPSRPSSLALSVRPPSVAGSTASHVYSAPKPTGRVPRPSPISHAPRRRSRSRTPASACQSVNETYTDIHVQEPPRPEFQMAGSLHHDRNSVVVGFGPLPVSKPEGRLRPMVEIDRYEKHKKVVVPETINQHVCPPVTIQFLRESLPENWTPLMHPEGALYWVHESGPIYTDTNMCDPVLRQRMEEALEEIYKLKDSCPSLPVDHWELALELGEDAKTGELICSYYFVYPPTRCLFWLHDFDLGSVLGGVQGVTEWPHIHLVLQAQYWNHWEMYPHNREIPEQLLQELLGILVHAGVDCMTSSNSTAPYPEGELNKLLGYVKHVTSVGGDYGFSACIVGRLMSFFTWSRYINFYGQKGARLGNDQTIYGTAPKRTYLIKSLTVFFFYAPELHLRGLESVYTDRVLCQHRWAQFITQLQDDWKEFILYGTVLLNANVAFLAIPSVDPGNRNRTPVQLSSYLSMITSIGSIVIGLLLLRQHRTKPTESSEEVDKYLKSRHDAALGFETLAILYSLPYSLLLWSTMAFSAAFILETVAFSRQLWAKLSVGAVLAMATLLISWCIWTTIEAEEDFSILGSIRHLKDRLIKAAGGLRSKTRGLVSDAGQCEGGEDQRENGKLRLKEAFKNFRRRPGTSTSLNLSSANPMAGDGPCRPSNPTIEVEMGEIGNEELGSAV